jgi:hypothetical protein
MVEKKCVGLARWPQRVTLRQDGVFEADFGKHKKLASHHRQIQRPIRGCILFSFGLISVKPPGERAATCKKAFNHSVYFKNFSDYHLAESANRDL